MTHRIVIVGGGAGGLELATRLGRTLGKRGQARITLVDANLTHIWKPLLHEVAAGSLNSSADELNYVAQAKWNHFEFQMGRMSALDRSRKSIQLETIADETTAAAPTSRMLSYDTLVIAVGSTTNDFGTPGAAEHCIFLDTRKQAERFHRQLLAHYMRAQADDSSPASIDMAIVGAGATGVELAAELLHAARELAAYGLDRISPDNVNITLIEAGPRVLPALPERISQPVHQTLLKLGVRVMTNAAVSEVEQHGLRTVTASSCRAASRCGRPEFRRRLFCATWTDWKATVSISWSSAQRCRRVVTRTFCLWRLRRLPATRQRAQRAAARSGGTPASLATGQVTETAPERPATAGIPLPRLRLADLAVALLGRWQPHGQPDRQRDARRLAGENVLHLALPHAPDRAVWRCPHGTDDAGRSAQSQHRTAAEAPLKAHLRPRHR